MRRLADRRKRRMEVSLPLQPISEQSAHETSIRHGHISILRVWRV
jgi:adenine-specific DNA methylase